MARKLPIRFRLEKVPRFISFDAGVVAGLLSIGIYLAIVKRNWLAVVLLALGLLWMISIPIRLRLRKVNGR